MALVRERELTAASAPPIAGEEERRRQLRRGRRRATGLLVAMVVVFVVLVLTTEDEGGWGYARAAAEAAMVGGLADWFAVTALFRHPLGIPIPHTAIVRARKDQFGETLGDFVQTNFLSPEVLQERIHGVRPVQRLAEWAGEPGNAERASHYVADALVQIADLAREDDVQQLVHEEIRRAIDRLPLADIAGRGLEAMIADGRHRDLVDAALVNLERLLDGNEDALYERFARSSPWWLPGAVERRLFDRVIDGVQDVLADVNQDPDHELRDRLDEWLAGIATRLRTDPDLRARVEQLKQEVLANPEIGAWSRSLWTDLKVSLRTQAADPESRLRTGLVELIVAAGARVQSEPELAARAEDVIERTVATLANRYRGEISDLVSGTISRWDGNETSDRLELLLGPDLQFIRINGTIVGGMAGLVIHAAGVLIG